MYGTWRLILEAVVKGINAICAVVGHCPWYHPSRYSSFHWAISEHGSTPAQTISSTCSVHSIILSASAKPASISPYVVVLCPCMLLSALRSGRSKGASGLSASFQSRIIGSSSHVVLAARTFSASSHISSVSATTMAPTHCIL